MGYTTDFYGGLKFSTPLTAKQKNELDDFAEERHGGNMEAYPGFPGFWCNWAPNADGTALEWNGGEKFYSYVEWLKYLIDNFFEPWGIKLNGEVDWLGEDPDDRGRIVVTDNEVKTLRAVISYEEV